MELRDGTFTSVWDDGAFSIDSPCKVDLDAMRVVEMGEAEVAFDEDGNPTYDENEIDVIFNEVGHLDEERVVVNAGKTYTAARAGAAGDAEDLFGNGILTYN